MIDMKRDVKRPPQEVAAYPEQDQYPGGLCLYLGEEEIAKLGIELPEVGAELVLKAKARVTSVSDAESLHGRHRSINLQVIAMEVGKPSESKDGGQV